MTDFNDTDDRDFEMIRDAFADKFRERFGRLLQGTAEDVEAYAAEMAADWALAASTGDQEAMSHLKAQTQMLGEKQRLTASRSVWGQVGDFVFDLSQVVSRLLLGGL